MNQTLLPILIGLAGVLMIFGPDILKVIQKAWPKRPAPQPAPGPEPVQDLEVLADGVLTISLENQDLLKVAALAHLTSIRRMLGGNTQAQDAIDTVLVPAVMKAEGAQK